jgi:hypothetical protein
MTEKTEVAKRATVNLSPEAVMQTLALRHLKELEKRHLVSIASTVMEAIDEKYARDVKAKEAVPE